MKVVAYKNYWLGDKMREPCYRFGIGCRSGFRRRYFKIYFWYWVVVFQFEKRTNH